MSAICPPVVVDLTSYAPLKYGLKSVSRSFPNLDPRWRSCGVQFYSRACPEANTWIDSCDSPGVKEDPPEPSPQSFDPFTVYADWLCGPLGMSIQEREAASRQALDCSEDREIEDYFYNNLLTAGDALALNTEGTAVSLAAGVGMLEGAMGAFHCGEPTIHAPREMGAMAARFHLTFGSGDTLRTPLGSSWVFGTGYGNEDPTGAVAGAGIAWLYATGPIYLAQSEVFMNPPSFEDALNRTNNEVRWEASRTSLVAADSCVVYGVAVSTEEFGGGGSGGSGGGLNYPSP